MKSALIIKELKLKLNIGVTSTERLKKQNIILQIKISFSTPPLGCNTGKISDTICYDKLIKQINLFCKNKKFMLIEEAGMSIFRLIKKSIPKKCKLYIRITKKPLIKGLIGGSSFELEK